MWEYLKRRSSYQTLPLLDSKRYNDLYKKFTHPLFQSVRIVQMENSQGIQINKTIVTLTKLIKSQTMYQCLMYIYTGTIENGFNNFQVATSLTLYLSYSLMF